MSTQAWNGTSRKKVSRSKWDVKHKQIMSENDTSNLRGWWDIHDVNHDYYVFSTGIFIAQTAFMTIQPGCDNQGICWEFWIEKASTRTQDSWARTAVSSTQYTANAMRCQRGTALTKLQGQTDHKPKNLKYSPFYSTLNIYLQKKKEETQRKKESTKGTPDPLSIMISCLMLDITQGWYTEICDTQTASSLAL